MHATTLLLERRHQVQELVAAMLHDEAAREGRQVELVDAVESLVVIERAAMLLLATDDATTESHRRAHDRARGALSRIAASAARSVTAAACLRDLADVFGRRSCDLSDRLAAAFDDAELLRFGRRLVALVEGLARPRLRAPAPHAAPLS